MVHPSRFGRIAAVGILALSCMCVRAEAQAFSTPKVIFNSTDPSSTPQVAVDGAGTIYVVWVDTATSNSTIQFSQSSDGGGSFSAPQNVSGTTGSSTNPRLFVDAQGGVNVVWVNNAPGNNDIFFSRSAAAGGSFSTPVNVSNDAADSLSPQLAVDASGNISVVWESDSTPFGVLYSHSMDGGTSFSPPLDLATNTGGSFGAQISVGTDGSINVVWEDDTNTASNISFSRSTDQGGSFSPAKTLSTNLVDSTEAQIALDASGNIDVIWADRTSGIFNIFFSRSTDQGANFSGPTNLSNGPANSLHAQIGADATGGVYVVWQQNVAADFNNRDIFLARSSDGVNFLNPTNLSNNLGNSTNAWITVDSTGAINLTWQDTTPGFNNIFFARSQDAGASFLTQNLSNDSGSSSDAQIAADKSGNLNVVWSDNASGVNQILFSRFSNPQAIKHPPVANAGPDQVLECAGPGGTTAKLDGSASTDPSGTALSYVWTDELGNVVGSMAISAVTVAMGTHAFTLTVTDAAGLAGTATTHITVQDTVPPTLSVSLSPNALWPPNHKLVPITATVVASDTCDANPTVQLVSITSSDALRAGDVQAIGGGPVAFGTDVRAFLLRSERSNSQNARIYTITYAATDASGHTTVASAQVQVAPPTQFVPLTKPGTKTQKHRYEKKDEDDKKDRDDKDYRHEDER
jgi:hypothetical protein